MSATVLCAVVCLLMVGVSTAASIDTASNDITKRQGDFDTGSCTTQQYLRIVGPYDPMCINNTARFTELLEEITGQPDQNAVRELRDLHRDICGNGCGRIQYRLSRECFPDDEEQAQTTQVTVNSCSSNGRFRCGLTTVSSRNISDIKEANRCLLQSVGNPDRCPRACRPVLRRVIADIGCCAYDYLQLLASAAPDSNVEILYSSCMLETPAACPDPYADGPRPTRKNYRLLGVG